MLDHLLIVGADLIEARGLERHLHRVARCRVVARAADAVVELTNRGPKGLLVDVDLPDGSGLDVAASARNLVRPLPVLVMAIDDRGASRRAHRMGARYIQKPLERPDVLAFALDVATSLPVGDRVLESAIADFVSLIRSSPREAELVALAAHGVAQSEIRERMRLSEEGYKSAIQRLLERCRRVGFPVKGLADVSQLILRWAIYGAESEPVRANSVACESPRNIRTEQRR